MTSKHSGLKIECASENYYFHFSTKTYIVATQKNRLNETVLLSTQNRWIVISFSDKYAFGPPDRVCKWKKIISHQNICCEHPQHLFKLMGRKIMPIFGGTASTGFFSIHYLPTFLNFKNAYLSYIEKVCILFFVKHFFWTLCILETPKLVFWQWRPRWNAA